MERVYFLRLKSGFCRYDGKVVRSGDIIEIYKYEKGIYTGGVNVNGRAGHGETTDEQKEKNRELVLMRARRELRRIINANVGQYGEEFTAKFLTLTFKDNVKDLEVANNEFRQFIKRLNYRVYKKKCSQLKYSAVVEFQSRGAVHYHIIFYNLPYIDAEELAEVWGNGFVKINKIDNIDNVGAYVCKYMTKSSYDDKLDDKLVGKKSYFNSRGLIKPIEQYLDYEDIENIKKSLPKELLIYKNEFESDYLGQIEYEQYNLKKNNY